MKLFFDQILFFYSAAIMLLLVSVGCENEEVQENDFIRYYCDAEELTQIENDKWFLGADSVNFLGVGFPCDNCGVNGTGGMRLDSIRPYGMNLILKNLKKGEYIEASVKGKFNNDGGAIIVGLKKDGNEYNLSSDKFISKAVDGWTELVVKFHALGDMDTAHFFLFSSADNIIFDDFEIKRFEFGVKSDVSIENTLNIYIKDSSKHILDDNLAFCINSDIIPKSKKNYVPAFIVNDCDTQAIEIRLKGDWTDHIKSGFPSYRIKTNDDYAFKGLRSFSIQHPRTRNFMHEWFMHELIHREGLLTTTYDFLPVSINNKFQGIYALEEHFDKQLLESRGRREGPILKLDETAFWSVLYEGNKSEMNFSLPYYDGGFPSVFKSNRTRKNPILLDQFLNGASLLRSFKKTQFEPEAIFDLNKVAKFYALMEVGNIVHGLAWHNRRFYFNPITQKLEHIGYDLQSGYLPQNPIGLKEEMSRTRNDNAVSVEFLLNRSFFLKDEFRDSYLKYLHYYSSASYLDSVMLVMKKEIKEKEELLSLNVPNYFFDKAFYYERAEYIRNELDSLAPYIDDFGEERIKTRSTVNTDFEDVPKGFFIKDLSIHSYVKKRDSNNYEVTVENYHLADICIQGYAIKTNRDSMIEVDSVIAKSFNSFKRRDVTFSVNHKPKEVYFKATNTGDYVHRAEVLKWSKPSVDISRNRLHNSFIKNSKFYSVTDTSIHITGGAYSCNQLLYIPKKYTVYVDSGVQIDFIKKGGLITNNSTYFNGTSENPIIITSSDSSSSGITVLNAPNTLFKEVEISNLNTLNNEGWVLTGGINIYDSKVLIEGLRIKNARSEDALNLIQCNFVVTELDINGAQSDGFDADFCIGKMEYSIFKNTKNDCVDFSGSTVTAKNISIENAGDKAFSVGEGSVLEIIASTINGAEMAFAAKDNSILVVRNTAVMNVKLGVAAFQKKPEYGPGKIELFNMSYKNVKNMGLLGLGSECYLDGKKFKGRQKIEVEKLYERFTK